MANQFLSGFERENQYNCMQCCEPITNPICHNCLAKDILKWLSFYHNVKKAITPKINKYLIQVNNEEIGSLNCVSCSKKAALCPYCFTEGIFSLLKRSNVNKNIIGDFLHIFNFDLHKEGYILNASEEGLY